MIFFCQENQNTKLNFIFANLTLVPIKLHWKKQFKKFARIVLILFEGRQKKKINKHFYCVKYLGYKIGIVSSCKLCLVKRNFFYRNWKGDEKKYLCLLARKEKQTKKKNWRIKSTGLKCVFSACTDAEIYIVNNWQVFYIWIYCMEYSVCVDLI